MSIPTKVKNVVFVILLGGAFLRVFSVKLGQDVALRWGFSQRVSNLLVIWVGNGQCSVGNGQKVSSSGGSHDEMTFS